MKGLIEKSIRDSLIGPQIKTPFPRADFGVISTLGRSLKFVGGNTPYIRLMHSASNDTLASEVSGSTRRGQSGYIKATLIGRNFPQFRLVIKFSCCQLILNKFSTDLNT